ncbi:MAG: LysM domain-containing protein [Pirellulales bacterium]
MAGDIKHVVQEGDCLSKIAKHYGFTWKKLWDYGPNATLKAKREDPNLLYPGDIVVIPEKSPKMESKGTNQKHTFKKRTELPTFQIRLLFEGAPLANFDAELTFQSPSWSATKTGKTDSDGNLLIESSPKIRIPGDTPGATLLIGNKPYQIRYSICLSSLPDHKTAAGASIRLYNLGYTSSIINESQIDELQPAIVRYARSKQQKSNGELSESVKSELKKDHGC